MMSEILGSWDLTGYTPLSHCMPESRSPRKTTRTHLFKSVERPIVVTVLVKRRTERTEDDKCERVAENEL